MTALARPLDATMPPLPGAVGLSLRRGVHELRAFFRQRELVIFTFALPVIIMVLFSTIFNGVIPHTGVNYRQYFIAGMIASGIMSATFVNIGVSVAIERDDGTLKRLAGTPLPKVAYFAGKAISALVITALEVAILLAIGVIGYGLKLPATPAKWADFLWVFILGVAACTMLGLAMSGVPRSGRSAAAVMNVPYLVLQFISGVYFVFSSLPKPMQDVAAFFPLKWLSQGLRSVFLPDTLLRVEPAGSWELGKVALVLTAWIALSLILCVRTFRWQRGGS